MSLAVAVAPCAAQVAEPATLAPLPPLTIPLPSDLAGDHARAVECLALAIAYEAGHEPPIGQQAVAEVILNRMRSPSYPKTVCGVVFAGGVRRTGCQFTFTCDGSLNRPMPAAIMERSRLVAQAVLSGSVAPVVPGATHYHAAYVSPYWAPSLVKLTRIGLHIFYRAPGTPGFVAPGANVIAGVIPDGLATVTQLAQGRGSTTERTPPAKPQPFSPWGL